MGDRYTIEIHLPDRFIKLKADSYTMKTVNHFHDDDPAKGVRFQQVQLNINLDPEAKVDVRKFRQSDNEPVLDRGDSPNNICTIGPMETD